MPNDALTWIISERGSELEPCRPVPSGARVIAQGPSETPASLAARVRLEVAGAARVETLVVAAGDRTDSEVLSSRLIMLRAATSKMLGAGGGRVHLRARARHARHAMAALAEVVSEQVRHTSVVVSAGGDTEWPDAA